MYNATEIKW